MNKIKVFACSWLATGAVALAGPYAPKAGQPGSNAIAHTDTRFVSWAKGNLIPEYGADVDALWKTPGKAYGRATTDVYDIVCLGNGGRITMFFPHPIMDGVGADFAVFENAFNDTFLELAFVEVSSDGVNFFRFPVSSKTLYLVGAFGAVDPTDIDGFAGKYKGGYGTPFDLGELPASPLLDKRNVRFVRIVDIIGDGSVKDRDGLPIYDPTPTVGSGGFDLDAIGVIHQNDGDFPLTVAPATEGYWRLNWESNPGSRYRIETSTTMESSDSWLPIWEGAGEQALGTSSRLVPISAGENRRFWRVVRMD